MSIVKLNFNTYLKNRFTHAYLQSGYIFFISVFSVLLVFGLCLLRLKMPEAFGTRPMLIMFMLPVVISAMFGGLWPGILTTVLAAILGDYLFIEPFNDLIIQRLLT